MLIEKPSKETGPAIDIEAVFVHTAGTVANSVEVELHVSAVLVCAQAVRQKAVGQRALTGAKHHFHGAGARGITRLGGAESRATAGCNVTGVAGKAGCVQSFARGSNETDRTWQTTAYSVRRTLMCAGRGLSAVPVPPSPVRVMSVLGAATVAKLKVLGLLALSTAVMTNGPETPSVAAIASVMPVSSLPPSSSANSITSPTMKPWQTGG